MVFFCLQVSAQEQDYELVQADTVSIDSFMLDHSPRKAALYSAVLPGLGQAYNKRYWKIPLVYAGIVGFGYAVIWNSREYNYYFDMYKYMVDNDLNEYEGISFDEVEWYKNAHLRYKNLMIIFTIGFYVLQIVDATVDAHLIDYDINDDISLTIDPVFLEPNILSSPATLTGSGFSSFGLRCCLSF